MTIPEVDKLQDEEVFANPFPTHGWSVLDYEFLQQPDYSNSTKQTDQRQYRHALLGLIASGILTIGTAIFTIAEMGFALATQNAPEGGDHALASFMGAAATIVFEETTSKFNNQRRANKSKPNA